MLLGLAAALSGCVTSDGEVKRLEKRLSFVEPQRTSRQEIIERLGEPTVTYEAGKLVVYVFVAGRDEPSIAVQQPGDFLGPHLVLEFDDADILSRYKVLVPP